MGLASRPKPIAESLRTPMRFTSAAIDIRIPLGLEDEYVTAGDHIAYFWETPKSFGRSSVFWRWGSSAESSA